MIQYLHLESKVSNAANVNIQPVNVVTFKDLRKRIVLEETAPSQQHSRLFERLNNKPFWIWNIEEHKREDIKTDGHCCFNHLIGLPSKGSVDKPLYDYERIIFDSLVTHNGNKHLWIKKATGLGVSEFMLRFMAWLCLKDNALSGSQMCIVTGPRIDLAIALIDRMKRLFAGKGLVSFDTKETVIELNGVKIEAFPSHHLLLISFLQDSSKMQEMFLSAILQNQILT